MQYFYLRFKKKWFLLAFFLTMVICLAQLVQLLEEIPFIDSPYERWFSVDTFHFLPKIFFILLPIFATLPAGNLLKEDLDNGMFAKLKLQIPLYKLMGNYVLVAFLTGALVIAVPLLINLLSYFLFLPNVKPDNLLNGNILFINKRSLLVSLYYQHPFLHALLSIVFTAVWSGIFAVFAVVSSVWIKNRFVSLCSSFILQIVIFALDLVITLPQDFSFSPVNFLPELATTNISLGITIIMTCLLIGYCAVSLFLGGRKIASSGN